MFQGPVRCLLYDVHKCSCSAHPSILFVLFFALQEGSVALFSLFSSWKRRKKQLAQPALYRFLH